MLIRLPTRKRRATARNWKKKIESQLGS